MPQLSRGGIAVRVSNWGMVVLGVYLIIVGLNSLNLLVDLTRINGIIGLIAGILILMEHWRR